MKLIPHRLVNLLKHCNPIRNIAPEYLSLCGITLTAFVALLDYTLVNTALPTIQSTFKVSVLDLQWVFNIYCIVIAVFMVISGRLGDRYGLRLMFYCGIIILGLGSYGAGQSDSFITLIIFRGIQSIGAATTITLAISLINHLFIGRAHYPMSFYAAITGLGLTLGPFLGGVIVMHLGWRWIFYINIPFLLVAFTICIPCLSEFKTNKSSYIDFLGAILLTITLSSLIYGIIRGEDISFFDPQCIVCIILFIISFPILIWVETQQVTPMINIHFFINAKFLSATSACIMGGILISPVLFFLPLFLQSIMQFNPKEVGIILLAAPTTVVISSPIIGKLINRFGVHVILFNGLIIGFLASVLYVTFAKFNIIGIALCALLLTGVIWAIINVGAGIAASTAVDNSESGVAVGAVFSIWNITSAITIAITTTIFHSTINSLAHLSTQRSFTIGIQIVFISILFAMAILVLIGLFLKKKIFYKGLINVS